MVDEIQLTTLDRVLIEIVYLDGTALSPCTSLRWRSNSEALLNDMSHRVQGCRDYKYRIEPSFYFVE